MTRPYRIWTTREEAYLKAHYETRGGMACARALRRHPDSVYARASALGLTRMPRRWTVDDICYLCAFYGERLNGELATDLDRSELAVRAMAKRHGLTRKRMPKQEREAA